jgi:hypothetical protein
MREVRILDTDTATPDGAETAEETEAEAPSQVLVGEVLGPEPVRAVAKRKLKGQVARSDNRATKRAQVAQDILDEMAVAISRPDLSRVRKGEALVTPLQRGMAVLAAKVAMGDIRSLKFVLEYQVGTPMQRSISLNAKADASTMEWLADLRGADTGDDASSEMADLDGEAGYAQEVGEDALS